MKQETAISRVKRLCDLIPYAHGRNVSIQALADDFGVSRELLIRDLEIAFMCGLPGYTPDLLIDMSMEGGEVTIFNPQVLDMPPAIDPNHLSRALLGLRCLEESGLLNVEHQSVVQDLREKILETIEIHSEDLIHVTDIEIERKLRDAIDNREEIVIDYLNLKGEKSSERRILPRHLFWRSGVAFLMGYDFEKKEMRNFALGRLKLLRTIRAEDGSTGKSSFTEPASADDDKREVQIRISSSAVWWARRYSALIISRSDHPNGKSIDLGVIYWEKAWMGRALASIADQILSIDDPEIRRAVGVHLSRLD
jgi:predicted DNA-binding transcriptional regulator YafY